MNHKVRMQDVKRQQEQLSAFVDNELSEAEVAQLLALMDDEQCRTVKHYHVIGDVMRDAALSLSCTDDFASRVAQAIAKEPMPGIVGASSVIANDEANAPASVLDGAAVIDEGAQHKPAVSRWRAGLWAGGVAAAVSAVSVVLMLQGKSPQPTNPAMPVGTSTLAAVDMPHEELMSHEERQALQDSSQALHDNSQMVARHVSSQPSAPTSQQVEPLSYERVNSAVGAMTISDGLRRTYPDYIRAHGDRSARSPFIQVKFNGTDVTP